MKEILSADGMKSRDQFTIEEIGIPSAVLMERAAYAAALEAEEMLLGERPCGYPGNTEFKTKNDGQKFLQKNGRERSLRVLALCGSGNNGGDGIAAARILRSMGVDAEILFAGNPDHMTVETRRQMGIALKLGLNVRQYTNQNRAGSSLIEELARDFASYDLLVDALFGIGLTRDVSGIYEELICAMNESGTPVLSVDIPSGIDADTGEVRGSAVWADRTITMQNLKAGLLLYPGAEYVGELVTAEIGVAQLGSVPEAFVLEEEDFRTLLPEREPSGNKGTFGKVLVLAGSPGMAGAAVLAGGAALHSGCGMVKILTHEQNRTVIQTALPEALFASWSSEETLSEALKESVSWADVVVAGPGLGTGAAQKRAIVELLAFCRKPLVLDADALNLIAGDRALGEILAGHIGPVTVTPHIGEMARLTGCSAVELKRQPFASAAAFSKLFGVTCVMKDARTVTALPDGRCYLNISGCSGMATAGSGDVLAGLTGGLIAQGADPILAGALSPVLHGMAGEAAASECGSHFLTASGMIEALASVMKQIFEM